MKLVSGITQRRPVDHRLPLSVRVIEPEWLDELPATDPAAIRSRMDIGRINSLMGHPRILSRLFSRWFPAPAVLRIAELGAGDGTFLLRIADRLGPRTRGIEAVLVDVQPAAAQNLEEKFAGFGWNVRFTCADALEWLRNEEGRFDLVLVNLLLHQFEDTTLRKILAEVARRAVNFVALEPRRAWLPLFLSRCAWVTGSGAVTRHDAPVSVRAGFSGSELSRLWPEAAGWEIDERRAGIFTHLFTARACERAKTG